MSIKGYFSFPDRAMGEHKTKRVCKHCIRRNKEENLIRTLCWYCSEERNNRYLGSELTGNDLLANGMVIN